MDVEEFRVRGKEMVDYICNYLNNIEEYRVTANVEPGYLKHLIPNEAPAEPENWDKIMDDVDKKIMPGITHWQHPHFHAYFPSGNSFPSILADMLSDAIGCIGFSWAASPACTELETIVMDWFGKAIGLPDEFIASSSRGSGGGVIQSSASECVLVSMLAARNQAIHLLKTKNPETESSAFLPQLVGYCSSEAHSCVEKAAKILLVKLRILEPDENGCLRGETLQKAMAEDKAKGLTPFYFSAILGSTSSCSFDNLLEIGPIIKKEPMMWLHVDAAYAGSAFICPELKPYLRGIEYADSFNTNPNKWLLTCFDCSCLWVKRKIRLTHALIVDPLYLQHDNSDEVIDYRHWSIQLSRRFRSLKLWFVFRKYGLSGLQDYIRRHIKLAKHFEKLVRSDARFEVVNDVKLGLVCFRLKSNDHFNRDLLALINASGKLHMIPSMVRGKYVIRFAICSENATVDHIEYAWKVIEEIASDLLETQTTPEKKKETVRPPLTRQKSKRFSFTRSVSKEIYKRSKSKSNLHDGATPILVADSDEDDDNEVFIDRDEILKAFTEAQFLTNDDSKEENCIKEHADQFRIDNKHQEITCNGAS